MNGETVKGRRRVKAVIIIISILCFIVILPFSVAWGMVKGAWREVKKLSRSTLVW
jgi:hypothetical protein